MELTVKAYAKVNLYLKIIGTDQRGYHLLKMKNVSVDIFDTVSVKVLTGTGIYVSFANAPDLDKKNNTAYKAAERFKNAFPAFFADKKISVSVKKGIPVGAGLGGSSADAAAVLFCLKKLFNADENIVYKTANEIGSDVAFMLRGGIANVEGVGEKIYNAPFVDFDILAVKPYGGISAALCYKTFDDLLPHEKEKDLSFSDDVFLEKFGFKPYNSLFVPATVLNDDVGYIADFLINNGADACFLTGSGSAVCAYFNDKEKQLNVLKQIVLDKKIEFAAVAHSKPCGVEIISGDFDR